MTIGFLRSTQPYSFNAMCRIKSGCSPSVANLRASLTVASVTPTRLAILGMTPLSYNILGFVTMSIILFSTFVNYPFCFHFENGFVIDYDAKICEDSHISK